MNITLKHGLLIAGSALELIVLGFAVKVLVTAVPAEFCQVMACVFISVVGGACFAVSSQL